MRVANASKCEDEKTLIYSLKQGSFSLESCNLGLHKFQTFHTFLFTFSIQSSRNVTALLTVSSRIEESFTNYFRSNFFWSVTSKSGITAPIFRLNARFFKRKGRSFPKISRILLCNELHVLCKILVKRRRKEAHAVLFKDL